MAKQKILLVEERESIDSPTQKSAQDEVYVVFLIQQELKKRTEQFIDIFKTPMDAFEYCRNTKTPAYCKYNERYSAHYVIAKSKGGMEQQLRVNFSDSQLLIKNIDFKRTDLGRTNNNPRLFWHIAKIPVLTVKTRLHKSTISKTKKKG